jgi:hypothetical protein
MPLKTDGKYLWAQVSWSIGGRVVDEKKVMFVDSAKPESEISVRNYRSTLRIIGKGAKPGHRSICLILDGGSITLDGRSCSWPVWYCPESNRDVLGCDQFTTLGIIPGVATVPPATFFGTLRMPVTGFPVEMLEDETGATPRPPGTGGFPTPPPGLFSLLAPRFARGY